MALRSFGRDIGVNLLEMIVKLVSSEAVREGYTSRGGKDDART